MGAAETHTRGTDLDVEDRPATRRAAGSDGTVPGGTSRPPRRLPAALVWLVPLLAWAGAARVLVALLSDPYRGLDVMDESGYVLVAQPWAKASAFNGVSGWYLGPALRALGEDVGRLRVLGVLLVFLAALWAARATAHVAAESHGTRWPVWLRLTCSAGIVAASLGYYAVFVRTPGYMWFASLGIVLTATGSMLLAGQSPGRWHALETGGALGLGVVTAALGKVTTGTALLFLVLLLGAGLAHARHRTGGTDGARTVGGALGAGALVTGLLLVCHLALVADLGTTAHALSRSAGGMAVVDPQHYRPDAAVRVMLTSVWNLARGVPAQTHHVVLLPLALVPLRLAGLRHHVPVAAVLCLPGLVLPAVELSRSAREGTYSGGASGLAAGGVPLLTAALTAGLAACVTVLPDLPRLPWLRRLRTLGNIPWTRRLRTLPDDGRLMPRVLRPRATEVTADHAPARPATRRPSLVALGVLLLALGFCYPLGSNSPYDQLLYGALGAFVCAASVWLTACLSGSVLRASVAALALAAVTVGSTVVVTTRDRAPYRLGPIATQEVPVTIVPGGPPLLLDETAARWVDDLRAGARAAGWRAGMPLVDMTFHPGAVLALDGQAPSTLLPAFPLVGTAGPSAAYALGHSPGTRWRDSWFLVSDRVPEAATDEAARAVDRRFPSDYVLVATAVAPYDRETSRLYRPRP